MQKSIFLLCVDDDVKNEIYNILITLIHIYESFTGFGLNIRDMMFPEVVSIELPRELVKQVNKFVESNDMVSKLDNAKVYNIATNETVEDVSRSGSLKSSVPILGTEDFLDCLLKVVYAKLFEFNQNVFYQVNVGDHADYIVYNNDGYFARHKDFVGSMSPNVIQYTAIIGLTEYASEYNKGHTIVYIPVTPENEFEHTILYDVLKDAHERLPRENANDFIKRIIKTEKFASKHDCSYSYVLKIFTKYCIHLDIDIGSLFIGDQKVIPMKIFGYTSGKFTLFQSGFFHEGEKFSSCYSTEQKKILTITFFVMANEKCSESVSELTLCRQIPEKFCDKIQNFLLNEHIMCVHFDTFESWMLPFVSEYNLIPFQVYLYKHDVREKYTARPQSITKTEDTIIRYLNSSESLLGLAKDITNIFHEVSKTIAELHVSLTGRTQTVTNMSDIVCSFPSIEILDASRTVQEIDIYVGTCTRCDKMIPFYTFDSKWKVEYEDEMTCNDEPDYTYMETMTTYSKMLVDVKWGFCKNIR